MRRPRYWYNVATPTKVWIIAQGLQTTSYRIDSPTQIEAEDYPPRIYTRD